MRYDELAVRNEIIRDRALVGIIVTSGEKKRNKKEEEIMRPA